MAKFFSTEKIIAIGLVVALILSLFIGDNKELQTNIAVGLIGFLGKTVADTFNSKQAIIEEVIKHVGKRV
ncbi:hypothetical protein [Selenomonas sp. AE3005]|uniref:hypothetical protein n=1 Tax=Selenomonas sp. AE3005 TaxID=1485543 RepID=UPI0025D275C3|nr:hypothetical protein [Selenomonas sp. AE3005]